MKNLFLIIAFAISFSNSVTTEEFKWYSWNEGFEKAKLENKKVMVFLQTDWCHWCKRMDTKTFNSTELAAVINADFIAVKLHLESKETYKFESKDYTSNELLNMLTDGKFQGIPATVFFDPETKNTVLEVGFLDVTEMKPLLEKYKKKI